MNSFGSSCESVGNVGAMRFFPSAFTDRKMNAPLCALERFWPKCFVCAILDPSFVNRYELICFHVLMTDLWPKTWHESISVPRPVPTQCQVPMKDRKGWVLWASRNREWILVRGAWTKTRTSGVFFSHT